MLTKDLVQYRTRNNKVFPKLLPAEAADVSALAKEVLDLFSSQIGSTISELGELLRDVDGEQKLKDGFFKLVLDQSDIEEVATEEHEKARYEILTRAQKLRENLSRQHSGEVKFQIFSEEVAKNSEKSYEVLSEFIYSDLKEFRVLTKAPTYTPSTLINRYNVAQIQGLLIKAKHIEIEFEDVTLAEKRYIFRMLKFYRLFAETNLSLSSKNIVIQLSGPMSLFQAAQVYGLRIAQFFPVLLSFKKWHVQAVLELDKFKQQILEIDDSLNLKSWYKNTTSYIPEEFSILREEFNRLSLNWKINPGKEFLNLGNQMYTFPDFELVNDKGQVYFLELFHRWHAHELIRRLKFLENNKKTQLFVAFSRELKSQIFEQLAEKATNIDNFSFDFKDFPTARNLLQFLGKHGILDDGV